jgi:hypothetical protein
MNRRSWLILAGFILMLAACATVQSVIKSTFPYTTTLVIPKSSATGVALSVTGNASSFDQSLKKDGNTGDKVRQVRVSSAKVDSKDFNLGNLTMLKVYLSKPDSTGEVLVASRTDIAPNTGDNMVLDIDNTKLLDEIVHQPKVRVRMAYQLRNSIYTDASLHFTLGIEASAGK